MEFSAAFELTAKHDTEVTWPKVNSATKHRPRAPVPPPIPHEPSGLPRKDQMVVVCATLGQILARLRDEPRDPVTDVECLRQALRVCRPLFESVAYGGDAFHGLPAVLVARRDDDKMYWFGFVCFGVQDNRVLSADRIVLTPRNAVAQRWDALTIIQSLRAQFEHAAELWQNHLAYA